MKNVRGFTVVPALPEALKPLRELAYNLWWTWNPDAFQLFRRLDIDLWEEVYHNPVRLLGRVDQRRLEQAAGDAGYMAHLNSVLMSLHDYMTGHTWFGEHYSDLKGQSIAYFSAEFGLHECLPIYSGGLGMLAGDHLKSASDLGLPLVGVGPALPAGLLPPVSQQRRLAVRGVPVPRLPPAAGEPRQGRRGQAAADHGRRRRHQRGGADLEGPGRPREPVPAGHQRAGQPPRGPADHLPALRRRPGHADPPGDRAGHRRRAGAGRDGHPPGGLPHERGALARS